MIDADVRIVDELHKVEQAVEKAAYRNFGHAAASIRKDAQASIINAPSRKRARRRKGRVVRRATHEASPPGKPPYTQRGQLRRAIVYQADKEGAIIGPRYSVVGIGAEAHEHGGRHRGGDFPQRPFMFPALERNESRFADLWRGSVQ